MLSLLKLLFKKVMRQGVAIVIIALCLCIGVGPGSDIEQEDSIFSVAEVSAHVELDWEEQKTATLVASSGESYPGWQLTAFHPSLELSPPAVSKPPPRRPPRLI